MKISDLLPDAARTLAFGGISEPRLEASSLLAFSLGRDRTYLIAHPEYELTPAELQRFSDVLSRRARREPFQHITGKQEFYGLDFEVNPDVLIPRPETEILVECAIELLSKAESPRICEVGIGSGCISVSILNHLPTATAVGLDISDAAMKTAARNAHTHGVADRLELRTSDVYSALLNEAFDAIVSNPPYIAAADMADLQPEVRDFEPHAALTDRGSGLAIIQRIISGSPKFLLSGGLLLIEIGFGQAESVKSMFGPVVWQSAEILDDLQGIPRIVRAALK